MKTFSLPTLRALRHSITAKFPQRSALRFLRRLPRMRSVQRTSLSDVLHVRPASTSPTRPARLTLLTVSLATPVLFLSSRLPGFPNNPCGVTETPNVNRGDTRVNYRYKKLEQLSVQHIQNARLKPASLLSYIRRAKSACSDQNAKLKRLTFLRLHLSNATFSSARSVPLLRDTRPASLQQNAGLIKSAFLKFARQMRQLATQSLHLFSAEA